MRADEGNVSGVVLRALGSGEGAVLEGNVLASVLYQQEGRSGRGLRSDEGDMAEGDMRYAIDGEEA